MKKTFLSLEDIHEIPVELRTQYVRAIGDKTKLTIVALVDISHVPFRKVDGHNENTLTVIGGVFDRNGNYIAGTEKILTMKLKDERLAALSATGLSVNETLDVARGSYVVRLIVRESEGQTISAQNGMVEIH